MYCTNAPPRLKEYYKLHYIDHSQSMITGSLEAKKAVVYILKFILYSKLLADKILLAMTFLKLFSRMIAGSHAFDLTYYNRLKKVRKKLLEKGKLFFLCLKNQTGKLRKLLTLSLQLTGKTTEFNFFSCLMLCGVTSPSSVLPFLRNR